MVEISLTYVELFLFRRSIPKSRVTTSVIPARSGNPGFYINAGGSPTPRAPWSVARGTRVSGIGQWKGCQATALLFWAPHPAFASHLPSEGTAPAQAVALLLFGQKKVTQEKAALPIRPSGSLCCSPSQAATQLNLAPEALGIRTVLADCPWLGCAARRWGKGF